MRCVSRIAALAAISLLLSACSAPLRPVTGLLQGELLWQGKVLLRGDVILAEGSRLRILPGTSILFAPPERGEDTLTDHPHFAGSELIVRGAILAEGRADAPIFFGAIDPHAPPGSWGGINLQQSPHAVFRYCRFTQADSALHSQESTVEVEQSVFEGNRVGIRFHTSAIRIENNLLRGNGTAIRFHFGAPVIRGNEIRNNDKGFFITADPRDFRLEANNIADNREFSVVLGEEVPADVSMGGNWWGGADLREIAETLFDGRREPHLGKVRLEPILAKPVANAGVSWSR